MRTKILQHLSLVLAALLFNACCHDDDPVKPASTRTVLVYIAGDNNLSDYINYNLEQMIEGAREGGLNQCDFLIYTDRATTTPALYQLKADETGRIDTVRIRDYAEHNSATPRNTTRPRPRCCGRLSRRPSPPSLPIITVWCSGATRLPGYRTLDAT